MAIDVSAGTPATGVDPAAPTTVRPTAGYLASLVLALLGGWFTVGLMLDAWAHNNIPELETFFTPWHGAFYSGFAATGGWVLWQCRHAIRDGQRVLDAVPVGYGVTLIALVGFALAGIGDLVWHTALGIEQNVDILFSPTHIGLIVSMLVIVTTPLRTAWADPGLPAAPGLRRLLPAVLGLTFGATLILLFAQYANALTHRAAGITSAMSMRDENVTSQFAAKAMVTTAVFLVPLLFVSRRWRLPVGTATIVFLTLGGLSTAVRGFENLSVVIGFVIGGVAADLLTLVLRPGPDQLGRLRLYAALVPLVTWTAILIAAYVSLPAYPQLPVKAELVTGLPLVQSMIGLLLAVTLVPTRSAGTRPA